MHGWESWCRWAEVWRQLRELRDAAFPALPPPEVLADLCTALLRCARPACCACMRPAWGCAPALAGVTAGLSRRQSLNDAHH
jgi:hypothetical protein